MRRLAAIALIVGSAASAHGDPISAQAWQEEVGDKIDYFHKKCGGTVTVSLDWPSFRGNLTGSFPADSAAAYCGEIVDTLGWICDNDASVKPAVQRIRSVRCAYDHNLGRKYDFDLHDGALAARYSSDSVNVSDVLLKWVQDLPADGAPPADAPPPDGHATPTTRGLTVRQARERAAAQPEIDHAASRLRAACGGQATLAADWASFEPVLHSEAFTERSVAGYCNGQVDELIKMCGHEPEAKRTLAHTLVSATCRYDASAGDHYTYAMQSGALVIGITPNSADDGEALVRWLWNTLD